MAVADLTIGPPGAPEVEPGAREMPGAADDLQNELGVADDAPHVDESVVRALLRSVAGAGSYMLGDPDVPEHWRFTDRELDDVVPPLTRIVNRRPQLRRAVARGDEISVALILAGYAGRNVAAGRAAEEVRDGRQREADVAPGGVGTDGPGVSEGSGADGRGGRGLRGPAS